MDSNCSLYSVCLLFSCCDSKGLMSPINVFLIFYNASIQLLLMFFFHGQLKQCRSSIMMKEDVHSRTANP
ncbi:hypothetical protein QVD17_36772 [Tagetes erecta]|uniref:Uncharacterized protein n=1 Tax=Tagetes erecta TaxID=13708 RepID=A0AAD8NIL2_TARER|nr:hypothetical protein QVD17_36772 [Tagetes erecta]